MKEGSTLYQITAFNTEVILAVGTALMIYGFALKKKYIRLLSILFFIWGFIQTTLYF